MAKNSDKIRKSKIWFTAPSLIVLLLAATLFWFFNQLKATDIKRQQTLLLIDTAQSLLHRLTEAETGARGFWLMGDESYLASYADIRGGITYDLQQLHQLTDNSDFHVYITSTNLLVEAKLAYLEQLNALKRTQDSNALFTAQSKHEGKRLMDLIRAEINKLTHLGNEELNRYNNQFQTNMGLLFTLIACAAVFMLLFAQGFSYGAYRIIGERLLKLTHVKTKLSLDTQEALNQQLNLAYLTVQQSEKKLEVTLNSIADAVIATDANSKVTLMNHVAEQLTGRTQEQAVNQPIDKIFRIVSKETREPVTTPVLDLLLQESAQADNHTILNLHNGNAYIISHSCAPIRDQNNNVIGSVLVFRDVSAEHLATQALHDSTQLVQSIVNTVLDGIITFHAYTNRIETVNPAAEKMFGYSANELIGKKFSVLVPELHNGQGSLDYYNASPEARANGLVHEVRGRTRDGDTFPMEIAVSEMHLGGQRYFTGVLRNVAARKLAEAVVRESEDRYRNLFNSIDEGFCVIELIHQNEKAVDFRFLEVNPSFEKQTGLHEAEGQCIIELAPDFDAQWLELFDKVAKTGEPVRFMNEVQTLGRWFDVYACRIGESQSRRVAVLLNNITERKRTEETLLDSERHLRSVIDALPVAIYTTDANGCLTHFNQAAVEFSGRTPELGSDHWCISWKLYRTDGAPLPHDECPMALALKYNQPIYGAEAIAERPDGTRVWFKAHPTPLRDNRGKLIGGINMLVDITERKQLDQALLENNIELKKAKYLAEKANLAKSDFLSSMSHELRTPLNAILGFAQLIDCSTPPPTVPQKRSVEQILQAGWYLLELINEILDLTLIESGKLSMSMEPVALADLMLECETMIEPQALNRNIKIEFPKDEYALVNADHTRLKQVLINLLSNAIKYNKEQGEVKVSCQEITPERLRISVQDTGKGLSAEKISQLFQPFNRLGQENGKEEGTGIGLVVTKKLVELMGGKIGVESIEGEGSQFWVDLDIAEQEREIKDTPENQKIARLVKPTGPKRTLLYIEDNTANLLLVEEIIAKRSDIHLLTARDGNSGVELARLAQPDLILMDINLSDISGIDALAILNKDPATQHIPVLALSANAMPHDIENGLKIGFFRYLTKPIRVNEFMETLDIAFDFAAQKPPQPQTKNMA
ncbi:MAG: PAS domain S-box protein [Pseudomonadota bacterium]